VANKKATYLSGQCINQCRPLQRDGSLTFALFGGPDGAVFDSATNSLYIVDNQNNQIRTVSASGVTTLAGRRTTG